MQVETHRVIQRYWMLDLYKIQLIIVALLATSGHSLDVPFSTIITIISFWIYIYHIYFILQANVSASWLLRTPTAAPSGPNKPLSWCLFQCELPITKCLAYTELPSLSPQSCTMQLAISLPCISANNFSVDGEDPKLGSYYMRVSMMETNCSFLPFPYKSSIKQSWIELFAFKSNTH